MNIQPLSSQIYLLCNLHASIRGSYATGAKPVFSRDGSRSHKQAVRSHKISTRKHCSAETQAAYCHTVCYIWKRLTDIKVQTKSSTSVTIGPRSKLLCLPSLSLLSHTQAVLETRGGTSFQMPVPHPQNCFLWITKPHW
jgi:hypothetical protein